MKLYLSSYRIPDVETFLRFINKPKDKIKLGLILNAKDDKPDKERLEKSKELILYFKDIVSYVEEIDLRNFYKNNNELESTLKRFDVLWFNGGNTFMLRYSLKESGLDGMIKALLEEGIVVGGDSAGAIVLGPTLKYFDSADDPSVAPIQIYEGLNMIDTSIIPHWESEKYQSILTKIEESLSYDGYKTRTITDEQFLLAETKENKDSFLLYTPQHSGKKINK